MAAAKKHGQARSANSKCPRFQGNPVPEEYESPSAASVNGLPGGGPFGGGLVGGGLAAGRSVNSKVAEKLEHDPVVVCPVT
jgi:hypothetical protein